jgi:hypothetical protein
MANDFSLLFNAIAMERPAGPQHIVIAAKGVAPQQQVDAGLVLPNMRHLVDKQALLRQVRRAEIIAIMLAVWVEMDAPARRHDDATRLEPPPFSLDKTDGAIIYGSAKDAFCQATFSTGQAASAQWLCSPSPPAAMAFADAVSFDPSANSKVRLIVSPAFRSGLMLYSITCLPPL